MANIILRTIDLNIFPIDKTAFGLLQEEKTRWKNITAEIESWKVRFPSIKIGIVNILATPQTTYDGYLTQFNKYNLESNYIKPANADALKEISELFKENSADSELITFLKEIANDEEQKALLEASFEDTSGGVLWVVFLLETFKNFYLNYLPSYINEKLTYDPVITLAEVKEKLKPVLSDTFATLYSSFVKVEQETDLEQLKTDTNNNLEKVKKVIYDARDNKKPVEPEKPDTPQDDTELNNLKLELADIYAYLDGVLEKQSQQPVYILTEEPEQMKREGDKPNPNYLIFESELINHPLIRDKVQERINKRKFSTPITINKEKPTKPDDRPNITQQDYQNLLNNQEKHKPEDLEKHTPADLKPSDYDTNISKLNDWQNTFPNLEPSKVKEQLESKPADQQPQPTPEQISKANQYDNIASIFPNGKIPDNLKELWEKLNKRPDITQEELNNLNNQLQQQGVKPEELKLLLKDNWDYLKGHIDILTNIIKRAVPTSKPDLSDSGSEKPKTSEQLN